MEKFKKDSFFKTGKVSRKIVMGLLILCLMLTLWLTTFAQQLASDLFNTQATNNTDWNIAFTKAVKNRVTGKAKQIKPVSYTSTTASFAVELTGVGDSISYSFTISNKGKIDAKVESIYIVPTNKESDALLFYVSNLEVGDELLAGDSKNLNVSVNFNKNYEGDATQIKKDVTILINFVQK